MTHTQNRPVALDIALRVPAEHLAELWQDTRYGLRMLRAAPGFTAVALISLSLGICVATSAYSELNGLVLRNVPGVPKPDELVVLEAPASYPSYQRYRERSEPVSSTLAYVAPVPFGVSLGGRTERTWGHLVHGVVLLDAGRPPADGPPVRRTARAARPRAHRRGQLPFLAATPGI